MILDEGRPLGYRDSDEGRPLGCRDLWGVMILDEGRPLGYRDSLKVDLWGMLLYNFSNKLPQSSIFST